jgi:hypothetical protein
VRTAELSDSLQGGLEILAKALEAVMKLDLGASDGAAFYPYGLEHAPDAASEPFHPGAAEIIAGDGARGIESYRLERATGHWLLYGQAFDAPWRLLARVHPARLPQEPADVAAELLIDLWALRQPARLRFVRGLESGALGRLRWRRVEAAVARPAPLEQLLRAEGLEVRAQRGPVGTTEHVLLLRRA